jgi:HJR/Mrr/RecB family endonuclease
MHSLDVAAFADTVAANVRSLIEQLAYKIEHQQFVSSFSTSCYDTAWLAMVRKPRESPVVLFPESFEYLMNTQNEDGGWPTYASDVDGILNTMAAMLALQKRQTELAIEDRVLTEDIAYRLSKAERYLEAKLMAWDVVSTVHVGFEVLILALLELLKHNGTVFEFPGYQMLMSLNKSKLSGFRPEVLYRTQKTTLIHSLEGFVGKIDFDQVSHHIDEHGSVMASPSATAAYLIHSTRWNNCAESFLGILCLNVSKDYAQCFLPQSRYRQFHEQYPNQLNKAGKWWQIRR